MYVQTHKTSNSMIPISCMLNYETTWKIHFMSLCIVDNCFEYNFNDHLKFHEYTTEVTVQANWVLDMINNYIIWIPWLQHVNEVIYYTYTSLAHPGIYVVMSSGDLLLYFTIESLESTTQSYPSSFISQG